MSLELHSMLYLLCERPNFTPIQINKQKYSSEHFKPSTIKPTNALYFLVMFINPAHVSAATEPSTGVLLQPKHV
jgi:hypothetical protein